MKRFACLIALALWSSAPAAQTYPGKPIRIIVPFSAGVTFGLCSMIPQGHSKRKAPR